MKCPICDKTLETSKSWNIRGVHKRRKDCPICLTEFTTTEKIDYDELPRYILDKIHERVGRSK